jgi:hypothetical protein
MSLRFDEVARLKELEKKATPVKWYKAEEDEGDCDEINGSIQGWETGIMVYNRELGVFHPTKEKLRVSESEYEEVDNLLTVCSPEQESDANLIAELRNASPWLLEVAGCFQRGDADEIAYARDVLASDSRYTGDPRVWTRLLRAAKIMEENE